MSDESRIDRLVGRSLLVVAFGLCLFLAQAACQTAWAQSDGGDEGQAEVAAGGHEESDDVGTEEAESETDAEAADLFTADELDTLVAPYALYPDSLLTQVFMASTFPLEIVKAQRWVDDNQDLPDDQREAAANAEGWDPSVAVLAAGFPTVIDKMSEDLDSTEDLGNALLAQSDDVLDAVQRQRARAQALGNLESNQAQTVEVSNDVITVEAADPQVVYVPTYDSGQVYTTQAPAQPAVVQSSDNSGSDAAALITTGLLSFGAGMLVSEIFDDDDDWDDYWRGPPRYVDWNDGNFYPRPGRGVYVDGDVNIDVNRNRFVNRDGAWQPDKDRRDQARDKIRERKDGGTLAGRVSGQRPTLSAGGKDRPTLSTRDSNRAKLDQKLKARSGDGAAKLGKPSAKRTPKAGGSILKSPSALQQNRGAGLTSTKKASNRGKLSQAKSLSSAGGKTLQKPGGISRPSSGKKLSSVSGKRTSAISKPQRSSAFQKSSGRKVSAQKSRGSRSRGTKRR